MKPLHVIVALLYLAAANQVFGGGTRDPIAMAKLENEELYRKLYTMRTGLQPNETNLLNTIGKAEGNLSDVLDKIAALNILVAETNCGSAVVPMVHKCYQQNSHWFVRVMCIEVLLLFDEKNGIALAKNYINDQQTDLEGRLSLAGTLIREKRLFGYPALKDGLSSTNRFRRSEVLELLNEFRPYDGKVWNDAGDRINIDDMEKLPNKVVPDKNERPITVNIIYKQNELIPSAPEASTNSETGK